MIDDLFSKIKSAGTNKIKLEFLNLPSYVRPRMKEAIKSESKEIQEVYKNSQSKKYREELEPIIKKYIDKYDFEMYYNDIVHHVSSQNLTENK